MWVGWGDVLREEEMRSTFEQIHSFVASVSVCGGTGMDLLIFSHTSPLRGC